ncbi:MAG: YeeE/YedE family protein [Bradymonadia bacterium]
MMDSIISAIIGGALIGVAASWLLLARGRIAGISGILGGLLGRWDEQSAWRLSFLGGLLVGGGLLVAFMPTVIVAPSHRSIALVSIAGLLVGFGTRLGSGCTSGHGVCGLTRFSLRSLVATLTFMVTGFVTASLLGVLG